MLQIGGLKVDRGAALAHARAYLTDGHGWAYPSYDGYDVARGVGPLTDADLLAPVLLNVQMKIATYKALQAARPALQGTLDRIPPELDLAEATDEDLALIGELFSALDGPGISGARGTVLSKVLHRKRPAFLPLYDEQVRSVYQDGPAAPVPRAVGRTWAEFMPLFARAVQEDLRREQDFWVKIAELAPGPRITPLRALDIVAWRAGRP